MEKWAKSIVFSHQFARKQKRLAHGDMDDNRIGKLGILEWNICYLDVG